MGRLSRFSVRLHANPIARTTLVACVFVITSAQTSRPADMVDVQSMAPDIIVDIRYFTEHNFIGRPIPGYRAQKCLLTRAAAEALARVQSLLRDYGLSLKVYDCYRPQRAVDYFVEWAVDRDDQTNKAEFYPSVDKGDLFRDGYIAERSGHSRGSTVDLTIAPVAAVTGLLDPPAPRQSCEAGQHDRFRDRDLDMGTSYDCFSPLSHTLSPNISAQQRSNRLLLGSLMESNGFTGLAQEWWHFTFAEEPYPDTYFDFPVE